MRMLIRYLDQVARIVGGAGATLGATCIALMTLLITVEVLGRTVYVTTFISEEFSGYLLVGLTFLGVSFSQRRGNQITIEFIRSRLPQRIQEKLQVVNLVIAMVFTAIATWLTINPVLESLSFHRVSLTIIRTPIWIIQLFVPVGFAMLTLEFIVEMIQRIHSRRIANIAE